MKDSLDVSVLISGLKKILSPQEFEYFSWLVQLRFEEHLQIEATIAAAERALLKPTPPAQEGGTSPWGATANPDFNPFEKDTK